MNEDRCISLGGGCYAEKTECMVNIKLRLKLMSKNKYA